MLLLLSGGDWLMQALQRDELLRIRPAAVQRLTRRNAEQLLDHWLGWYADRPGLLRYPRGKQLRVRIRRDRGRCYRDEPTARGNRDGRWVLRPGKWVRGVRAGLDHHMRALLQRDTHPRRRPTALLHPGKH